MGTPSNRPVPTGMEGWMRDQERRTIHQERRPQIRRASDLLGPGIAPQAVEIPDWSHEATEFNGFFVSRPGALHTPDSAKWWIGWSLSQDGEYGVQEAHDFRGGTPDVWRRTWALVGDIRLFTPWAKATGSGGGSVAWDAITGKPTSFPPSAHQHPASDISSGTLALARIPALPASQVTSGVFPLERLPAPASGQASAAQLVKGDDPRLSDARTPLAHNHDGSYAPVVHTHTKAQISDFAHTHAIADLPVAASGTSSSTQLVRADDSRLSNSRTPLAHTHAIADLPVAASGESSATKVPRADDARLSDTRTPKPHSHILAELQTTGIADATTFLRGDGQWATPAAGSSVSDFDPGDLKATTKPITAGVNEPNGWLLCDGRAVPQSWYPNLFAAIGHTWGADPGGGGFVLPDGRGRQLIGAGSGYSVGARGGNDTHVIDANHLPPHTHGAGTLVNNTAGAHTHQMTYRENAAQGGTQLNIMAAGGTAGQVVTKQSAQTDGSHTHNITGDTGTGVGLSNDPLPTMDPFFVGNWLIKT